ncbi:MAG TPA: HAMP domain-containing sensor histidine kinase [Longimicrobiales bacterium]
MSRERSRGFERRLFGWLWALTLAPALVVLVVSAWVWAESLDLLGTLGPWGQVAESGRALVEAARGAAEEDPALAEALARHHEELSASVLLASRWAFLGRRAQAVLPFLVVGLGVGLGVVALAVSRRLARDLARPIQELVEWAERLGREEPLPERGPAESRDVREVRALREALRRAAEDLAQARRRALEAERVRAWGELARRVAHEMKNALTPLRLALHRLQRGAGESPEFDEPFAVMEEEIGRLEELARQFAALGRPPAGPMSEVDLRELLGGLLESDVPPAVATALSAPAELPLVAGHYEALVRAFRNVLRNAVEAMEGRPDARIEVRISAPPGWVEVVVADTGPGLPAGAGDRIFEPDFTTKSRGTGLGLALVRQAITAHGGEVQARNRPEGGAEFLVRLPVAETAALAIGA